jgi:tetratricopeptide (TPR) repeat protein
MSFEAWKDSLSTVCEGFQMDLSCLLDSELDSEAAGRAMMHMEACASCREFFEDTRTQIRLHKDTADPDRILARVAMLTGRGLHGSDSSDAEVVEGIHLVHGLATIYYQLGKAYVLAAIDPDYRERVFEAAVPVNATQARGRGFVDGVVMTGKEEVGGLDWKRARSMLNGRLERIQSPLEKGRKLLEESVSTDPSNEEAQLYLAFLHAHEGRRLVAAEEYQRIFETAVDDQNRGHAAIQLGRLHSAEKNYPKAVALWRWVTISGLADRDDRFFVARFNLGMVYALMRNQARSLEYFRTLVDRHPARLVEVAELFRRSHGLRDAIDSQAGFAEALLRTCPELFAARASQPGVSDAETQEE